MLKQPLGGARRLRVRPARIASCKRDLFSFPYHGDHKTATGEIMTHLDESSTIRASRRDVFRYVGGAGIAAALAGARGVSVGRAGGLPRRSAGRRVLQVQARRVQLHERQRGHAAGRRADQADAGARRGSGRVRRGAQERLPARRQRRPAVQYPLCRHRPRQGAGRRRRRRELRAGDRPAGRQSPKRRRRRGRDYRRCLHPRPSRSHLGCRRQAGQAGLPQRPVFPERDRAQLLDAGKPGPFGGCAFRPRSARA